MLNIFFSLLEQIHGGFDFSTQDDFHGLVIIYLFILPVPNVYPVDLFEHIWVVDRLERLGISRYFQQEIKDSINYVSRYVHRHVHVRKDPLQCVLPNYSLD